MAKWYLGNNSFLEIFEEVVFVTRHNSFSLPAAIFQRRFAQQTFPSFEKTKQTVDRWTFPLIKLKFATQILRKLEVSYCLVNPHVADQKIFM